MLNVDETGSDDWWLHRLATELGSDFGRLYRLKSYRDGDALVPEEILSNVERDAWVRFAKLNRLHVTELLRDARTAKQKLIGFRTAAPNDVDGDAEAWRLWHGSKMDAYSTDVFNDVGDFGAAYLTNDLPEENAFGELVPSLRHSSPFTTRTYENARRPWETEVAVEVDYDALNKRDIIRFWRRDPQGRVYARIAYQEAETSMVPTDGAIWAPGTQWEWDSSIGTIQLPLRQVPVSKIQTPSGFGIYEKHLDTIDRINYITLQMMQIIVTQAFRQSAIAADLPSHYPQDDPEGRGGEPIDYSQIFKTGPAALWRLPSGGELQSFSPVDSRPIKEIRDDEVKKLATVTSTPYYMLSSDSANNSAEGALQAADSLLSKVDTMNTRASVGIGEAMARQFEFMGDIVRSDSSQIELIWAPLKRASLSEIGSAASQAKAGGATQRYIDEEIFAMTPAQRAQAAIDREEEALFGDG